MFRAIKQHATGTYHVKQRHGMLILKTKNKTPLLDMSQKGIENTIHPCKHSKIYKQIQT